MGRKVYGRGAVQGYFRNTNVVFQIRIKEGWEMVWSWLRGSVYLVHGWFVNISSVSTKWFKDSF